MYDIMRSTDEIDEQLNRAAESADKGESRWPGMTFEQGVDSALRWIVGLDEDEPIEEDE